MKTMRFLLLTGTIIMTTIPCTVVQSQDKDNGSKADPDVKWEVRKEYDENGNLIYYDSSCVHSWKHFDFPDDSLNQVHPKWQQLPRQQKKPARSIEI